MNVAAMSRQEFYQAAKRREEEYFYEQAGIYLATGRSEAEVLEILRQKWESFLYTWDVAALLGKGATNAEVLTYARRGLLPLPVRVGHSAAGLPLYRWNPDELQESIARLRGKS